MMIKQVGWMHRCCVVGLGALVLVFWNVHAAQPAAAQPIPVVKHAASVQRQASAEASHATHPPLTPLQQAYLALADRYQIVRLQHKLAEEEAAVAQAKAKLRGLRGQTLAPSVWQTQQGQVMPRLLYVDHQAGSWSAVLQLGGHEVQVRPKMILSNGDKVLKINATGVLLAHDGQHRWLRFHP